MAFMVALEFVCLYRFYFIFYLLWCLCVCTVYVFFFPVLFVAFLFLQRLGVAFGFINPFGRVGSILTREGFFLTWSAHWSEFVCVCLIVLLFLRSLFLCYSRSVEFCRFQERQVYLQFGSICDCVHSLARKSFYACCLFRGLLARGSGFVLAAVPFAML
jgi:hypothetical protein